MFLWCIWYHRFLKKDYEYWFLKKNYQWHLQEIFYLVTYERNFLFGSNSRKQFIQKQTILSDLYITSVSWIYFKLSWGWINSEKFHRIVIRTYYFPQHTIILSGGYRTISNFQFYFAFLQLYFYNVVIKDWHRFFRDTAFY